MCSWGWPSFPGPRSLRMRSFCQGSGCPFACSLDQAAQQSPACTSVAVRHNTCRCDQLLNLGVVCYIAPWQEVLTCSLRRGRDRWFLQDNLLLYSRCPRKFYKGGVLVLQYCWFSGSGSAKQTERPSKCGEGERWDPGSTRVMRAIFSAFPYV